MSHHGECDIDPERAGKAQVLNSLLAEHMTLDQAATLMGVSTRPGASWRLTGRRAQPHSLTDIVDAEHPTSHRRRQGPRYYALLKPVSGGNHTHLSELLREREGQNHAAAQGLVERRPEEPAPPSATATVRRQRMPREGMLIHRGRQPSPMVGRRWFALRPAAGGGRRHPASWLTPCSASRRTPATTSC